MLRRVAGGTAIITAATNIRSTITATTITPGTTITTVAAIGIANPGYSWAIVWPPLSFKAEYLMAIVAMLGATISPYLFFWQEVEDTKEGAGALPLTRAPEQARANSPASLYRYGDFQSRRPVHRHHHRDDVARAWRDPNPDFRVGRRSATGGGRAADLRGIRCRHHPHRHAGAGGIGGLCVGRGARLARRPGRLPPRAKAFYATIAVGMALGVA